MMRPRARNYHTKGSTGLMEVMEVMEVMESGGKYDDYEVLPCCHLSCPLRLHPVLSVVFLA